MIQKLMITALLLVLCSSFVYADEDDIEIFGFEAEELLSFGSGILATILFVLTFVAYRRTHRSKLGIIALAFLLFAAKAYLDSAELFIDEIEWLDLITSVLDFVILLLFFFGVLKK